MDKLRENEVRALVDAGAIRGARALADGDRWYVVLDVGTRQRVLASHRRHRREYRDLTRLVKWLRELGIGRVEVDSTHFSSQGGAAL